MSGEYVNGYIFGSSETVTSAKLNSQFTAGVLQNVARTHFDSSTRPVINSASMLSASLIGGEAMYLNTIDEIFFRNAVESEWSAISQDLRLTNKSGGSVVRGDVVIMDTTTAKSFITTTTANKAGLVGVALDTIASNAVGPVRWRGYVPVNVTGATTIGQLLATSTTAKKADPSTGFPTNGNAFGQAVTTSSTQVNAFLYGTTTSDFATVAKKINKQVFTANGTFTASKTTKHKITVIGGGGSGAGGTSTNPGGGGGGAGGTGIGWQDLTASTGYTVTVGASVAGVSAGANGTNGNNSSFAGTSTITGGGGSGGVAATGAGGAGGTASNGDINITGGDGDSGSAVNSTAGGTGGASSVGGGGRGGVSGGAGQPGNAYGAGGGGGGAGGTASGASAAGAVIVEWIE